LGQVLNPLEFFEGWINSFSIKKLKSLLKEKSENFSFDPCPQLANAGHTHGLCVRAGKVQSFWLIAFLRFGAG